MSLKDRSELHPKEILDIADDVADRYGLRRPSYLRMLKEFNSKYLFPMVLNNGNGTLWVDRYYVAYKLSGQTEVRYAYITKFHMLEEMYSYKTASKLRNIRVKLPVDIQKQFVFAFKHMYGSIWVDPDWKWLVSVD